MREGVSYFDWHCDTATTAFLSGQGLNENKLSVDFARMARYDGAAAFFAVFAVREEHPDPFGYVRDVIDFIRKECESAGVPIASDPTAAIHDGIGAAISVEGGDALSGGIGNVERLREMGVSMLTPTWNGANEIGFGAYAGSGGLTRFGTETVKEMERVGMIADVSHLNDDGFRDVARIAKRPFAASHSNARALCGNARNLTDDQIKAIADAGGVIGLNFYTKFLSDDETAGLPTLIRHAEHIMNVGGENVAVLGSDFDGMKTPLKKAEDASGFKRVSAALVKAFGEETARNIMIGNSAAFFERYNGSV